MDDAPSNSGGFLPLAALLGRTQARYIRDLELILVERGYPHISLAHGANVLNPLGRLGRASSRQLADDARISKQAVSQQVAQLIEHGYVTATVDPADQRARTLELTTAGQECLHAIRQAFQALEQEWAERYGSDVMDALRTSLQTIQAVDRP